MHVDDGVASGELEPGVVVAGDRDGIHQFHERKRAHERRGADDGRGEEAIGGGVAGVERGAARIGEEVSRAGGRGSDEGVGDGEAGVTTRGETRETRGRRYDSQVVNTQTIQDGTVH